MSGSFYFNKNATFSIGTQSERAFSVSTLHVSNCQNISFTPLEYDLDTNEPLYTGIFFHTGYVSILEPCDITGGLTVTGPIATEGITGTITSSSYMYSGEHIEAASIIKTRAHYLLPLGQLEPNPPPGYVALWCDGPDGQHCLYAKRNGGSKKMICLL